jgi:AcrR family transcriptional regulator
VALIARPDSDPQADALARRTSPTQKRAHARIALIFSVTERLIAAAADVPVSSIYRYFPNVEAIFKELFEQLTQGLHRHIQLVVDDVERWPSWRARHGEVMGVLRRLLNDNPAYRPLFQLMLSTQALRVVKERANAMIAAHLGARWARGEDGFRGGDAYVVARMATEIFTSFESLATADGGGPAAEALFAEVAVALESYLSVYLGREA